MDNSRHVMPQESYEAVKEHEESHLSYQRCVKDRKGQEEGVGRADTLANTTSG